MQQRIGASRFTVASPVLRPTLSGPELAAERQELLVHQRLDRARVNRAPPLREALKMQRRRHQRFARAGRRIEDDVLVLEQLQDRRLLRRIKLQPPLRHVFEKTPEQRPAIRDAVHFCKIEERGTPRSISMASAWEPE